MGKGSKNKNKKKQKRDKDNKAKRIDNSHDEGLEDLDTKTVDKAEENLNEITAVKRVHEDVESDTEEQPRRKKKKKQAVAGADTSTSKKGKKSIRQMKREKYAMRKAEAEAASKDQLKSQCLTYLSQWKHDRENWKFMKVKQLWLSKHKFTSSLIPDESWSTLLEYFNSAKGNIRNILLEDANKVIKTMEDWTEHQNKEENDFDPDHEKPDVTAYNRARDLIQCLEE